MCRLSEIILLFSIVVSLNSFFTYSYSILLILTDNWNLTTDIWWYSLILLQKGIENSWKTMFSDRLQNAPIDRSRRVESKYTIIITRWLVLDTKIVLLFFVFQPIVLNPVSLNSYCLPIPIPIVTIGNRNVSIAPNYPIVFDYSQFE